MNIYYLSITEFVDSFNIYLHIYFIIHYLHYFSILQFASVHFSTTYSTGESNLPASETEDESENEDAIQLTCDSKQFTSKFFNNGLNNSYMKNVCWNIIQLKLHRI